jgi:hypothetical protein
MFQPRLTPEGMWLHHRIYNHIVPTSERCEPLATNIKNTSLETLLYAGDLLGTHKGDRQ